MWIRKIIRAVVGSTALGWLMIAGFHLEAFTVYKRLAEKAVAYYMREYLGAALRVSLLTGVLSILTIQLSPRYARMRSSSLFRRLLWVGFGYFVTLLVISDCSASVPETWIRIALIAAAAGVQMVSTVIGALDLLRRRTAEESPVRPRNSTRSQNQ